MSTWIVVANRTGARIVERTDAPLELALVREFENPQGRKQSAELDTDRPGLAFSSAGPSGGHPMNTEESAHDHVAKVFAREVALALEHGRVEHRFTRLILVAEPRFLGFLREALPDQTAALVVETVKRDLAQVSVRDLAGHLAPFVLNSHPR